MTQDASDHKDLCFICLNDDVPRLRATRNTKKVNWICCDVCQCWFHAKCGGITANQYNRIKKDRLWLKCIVCCLNQIHVVDSEEVSAEGDSSFNSRVLAATKKRSEFRTGCRKKQVSVPSTQKPHLSVCEVYCSEENITNCDSVAAKNRITVVANKGTTDRSKTSLVINDTLHHSGNTSLLSQSEQSTENLDSVVDQHHIEVSDHISEHTGSQEQPVIEEIIISRKSDADNILVIDNLHNTAEFSSSRRILKEVHNFFPDIKIEFAYSLSKGGVSIHTTCKSDRDFLLQHLPPESFSCGVKHPPKVRSSKVLFIKGLDTSVDLCCVTEQLSQKGIEVQEIRRLSRRHTGILTQVVKVKCCDHYASVLLKSKLVVKGRVCRIEKERPIKVIRCFNCQSLGHTSRYCTSVKHCEFCAQSHGDQDCCSGVVQCFNCRGRHPTSSSECPVYLSRYALLAKQYTEC